MVGTLFFWLSGELMVKSFTNTTNLQLCQQADDSAIYMIFQAAAFWLGRVDAMPHFLSLLLPVRIPSSERSPVPPALLHTCWTIRLSVSWFFHNVLPTIYDSLSSRGFRNCTMMQDTPPRSQSFEVGSFPRQARSAVVLPSNFWKRVSFPCAVFSL